MVSRILSVLEDKLDDWLPEITAVFVSVLTVRLSFWATEYATTALTKGADLMGTAAVITAVAGVPSVLLGILFTKLSDLRKTHD